nr:hypothetical protein [Tanacetum cinerariifolium]
MSSVSPSNFIPHASRHCDQDDHPDDNHKGEKNSKKQKSTFDSSSANVTTSTNPTSSKSEVVHKSSIYATQPPIPSYDETWPKLHEINNGVDIFEEAYIGFIAEIQGKTLYEYYWRFSQLINDVHTSGMTMQQVQVNTKFLNALPSKWSKFVTDQREDPIECFNKAMAFVSAVASEGHMERPCTQPKRLRNVAWFKEKLMLAEAQEAGLLDEEQLAFLVDPDCDDLSSAKVVMMENISSCDPEVLSE